LGQLDFFLFSFSFSFFWLKLQRIIEQGTATRNSRKRLPRIESKKILFFGEVGSDGMGWVPISVAFVFVPVLTLKSQMATYFYDTDPIQAMRRGVPPFLNKSSLRS
jgi:hypothetical protein